MRQQVTLKLGLPAGRQAALLRHPLLAGAAKQTQLPLVSIYYDTRRLALRKAGILVRLRRGGAAWNQTVKRQAPSDGGLTRRPEWHAPYLNHFDFSGIDDADLREWLQRGKIAPHLSAIFETNLKRTIGEITPRPGARVLYKLDRGWVASSGRRETISELELQLLEGNLDDLYDVALSLAESQPLPLLLTSKAERGYRIYMDLPRQPVKAGAVDLDPKDRPLAAFRLIALNCLTHLQSNHEGAILSDDPEYVHQMRVATRRLRAAMRMFRPILPPGFADQLVGPLRELMQNLGRARDLDVLMAEIVNPVAAALPDEPRLTDLAGAITDRLYAARENTRQILQRPAYGRMLITAARLLNSADFISPPDMDAADTPSLRDFADRRLRSLLARVTDLANAARIDHPPSLHELRIAIKRLRYAIEFFGEMIPGHGGQRIVKRLAALQEELGQLNDLANAGLLLMACASSHSHLREAVTLIGGWHGPRHAALLEEIPDRLATIRRLKLPRLG